LTQSFYRFSGGAAAVAGFCIYVLKKEKFFLRVIEFPSEMHPAVNDYRKLFNQSTCDAGTTNDKQKFPLTTRDECYLV
jgi:hypothetical protein